MSLQIVFHGINRSAAVETVVQEKLELLRRFDNQLGDCKVTVTQEGHQTVGAFTIKIDLVCCGKDLVVSRTNMDVNAAIAEAFDTIRRSVVDEVEKRRSH